MDAGGVGGCTSGDCETLVNEVVDADGATEVAVEVGKPVADVVTVELVCTWW